MPTVQTAVQNKLGAALLSTVPDLTATRQLATLPATVSTQALDAASKHVEKGRQAEEDSESTDAGSSESETDMGFLSSASCSDAGSDVDSIEKSRLLRQLHRRSRPAPARRFRLGGCAGRVFRGTQLPTIPATPASKTSTWGAEDLATSEDEEDLDSEPSESKENGLQVVTHSALSPAPDRPAPMVNASQYVSAPPGLPPASVNMFRPPPGLPPPPSPGLQLTRPPDAAASSAPQRHSTPTTLPVDRPILSTVPPQHLAPFTAPQQKFAPGMVPPSHQAPTMSEAEFQSSPPDWDVSGLSGPQNMDVKDFLARVRAEKMQSVLSTQGVRRSLALTAR